METLLFLSSNKKWRHRLTHSPPRPLAAPTRAAGRAYVCDATLNRRPRVIRSQHPFLPHKSTSPSRAGAQNEDTHATLHLPPPSAFRSINRDRFPPRGRRCPETAPPATARRWWFAWPTGSDTAEPLHSGTDREWEHGSSVANETL